MRQELEAIVKRRDLVGEIFPHDITWMIQRIIKLESGLNHIIAETNAYVLEKNGYKHSEVHNKYRRMAQRTLRGEA